MTLTWKKHLKIVVLVLLIIFASLFFFKGNQRQAHATTNPDLGNLGSEIVCFVFTELNKLGSPIPVLSAGDCQNPPGVPAQCTDGIDNDGDGAIDYPADLGCTSASDNTEAPNPSSAPQCSDGVDNDDDEEIDYPADLGCTSTSDDSEAPNPTPAPVCSDGIDNDGDGKIDLADPGCSGQADTDEADPPPSNGGGNPQTPPANQDQGGSTGSSRSDGRSGGFSTNTTAAAPVVGQVLGAETCEEYLLEYIKFGAKNNPDEVLKLQSFLRDLNGFFDLQETGVYDAATHAAVHEFQKMYATVILTPWGATRSTGYVYYTTKKTINEIHCKFIRQFPLTSEQQAEITRVKTFGGNWGQLNVGPLIQPLRAPKKVKSPTSVNNSSGEPRINSFEIDTEETATVGEAVTTTPETGWFKGLWNWLQNP